MKLWQKRKKSQTPQPGIEPGTPANAADALPLSHRDKRHHQLVCSKFKKFEKFALNFGLRTRVTPCASVEDDLELAEPGKYSSQAGQAKVSEGREDWSLLLELHHVHFCQGLLPRKMEFPGLRELRG